MGNTTSIWGNASRSAEIVAKPEEEGLKSRIYCKGASRQSAEQAGEAEHHYLPTGSGACRARVRDPELQHVQNASARHLAGAGECLDRAEEPHLRLAPLGAVGVPHCGWQT